MGKLSIIIPVYYNEETLQDLYEDLQSNLLCKLDDYELVLVDDGSEDASYREMKKLAARDAKVVLIKLARNFGSHAAILAGLAHCTGDCATVKAADLQEPSALILDMYASWKRGNKVVLAVRSDRDEKFSQKLFANIYYALVRKFALSSMPKGGFDCYLIDRKVIEVLKQLDEKNSALTLQILWAGFQTENIYYIRQKREKGKSRWTLSKKIKLVVDSLVSFSFLPIRFMSMVGFLFFIISLIWGLLVACFRLMGNIPIEGFTTLMILLLFSSGLVMLTLGILGEYVWRSMDAARTRPVYIVDETQSKAGKVPNKREASTNIKNSYMQAKALCNSLAAATGQTVLITDCTRVFAVSGPLEADLCGKTLSSSFAALIQKPPSANPVLPDSDTSICTNSQLSPNIVIPIFKNQKVDGCLSSIAEGQEPPTVENIRFLQVMADFLGHQEE